MKFALCSPIFRNGSSGVDYFQPLMTDPLLGVVAHWEQARHFNSQAEAALAIPAFLELKHEERKARYREFGWPISEIAIHDPIHIVPV
jgi:hypothetical protein